MPRRAPSSITGIVRRFLQTETASGVACVVAIAVALVAVNSPWHASYESLWSTHVASKAGWLRLPGDVRHWIGEGAMVIFFFVIGLEIKRELVAGELRHWRAAALPVLAAAGGMLTPALIYLALTAGRGSARGWAVPMATDLAVALAVVTLLGPRVSRGLKLFVLTLAVADDVGSVIAIAVGFTAHLGVGSVCVAMLLVVVLALLAKRGLAPLPVAVVLGAGAWLATLRSGVHPTVLGVALAFALPVGDQSARLEDRLHAWGSIVIVPAFLAAAEGVRVSSLSFGSAGSNRVAVAVTVARVLGKPVGITLAAWLAVKLRVGRLPAGATWFDLAGVGVLCGIGLTVAVLVVDLSFSQPTVVAAAKFGVLSASAFAAVAGAAWLGLLSRWRTRSIR